VLIAFSKSTSIILDKKLISILLGSINIPVVYDYFFKPRIVNNCVKNFEQILKVSSKNFEVTSIRNFKNRTQLI